MNKICLLFQEIFPEETENNQHDVKWKVKAMEKYIREKGDSNIAFGLVAHPKTDSNNKRSFQVQLHIQGSPKRFCRCLSP